MNVELQQSNNIEVQKPNEKTDEPINIKPSEEVPIEENKEDELPAMPEQDPDKDLKKNLMFEQKNISAFQLYCHLSAKLEIIFMILGAIGSLGAGCAGPLMTLLFGDSLNDFGSVEGGQVDYDTLTPEQQKEFDAAILGGFGHTKEK